MRVIREIRLSLSMTQSAMADHLGCFQSRISRMEVGGGRDRLTPAELLRLVELVPDRRDELYRLYIEGEE